MKTIAIPLIVSIIGVLIAKFVFGVDVEGLAKGFADFLAKIFLRFD